MAITFNIWHLSLSYKKKIDHCSDPFIVVFLLILETILFCSQPFWKKSGESNFVSGKIKMGKETLCRVEGKWVSWLMHVEFVKS